MMTSGDNNGWETLERSLQELRGIAASLTSEDDVAGFVEGAGGPLESLHAAAEALELSEMRQAVAAMQRYHKERLGSDPNLDAVTVFSFALDTLAEKLPLIRDGAGASDFSADEILMFLDLEPPEESGADEGQAAPQRSDLEAAGPEHEEPLAESGTAPEDATPDRKDSEEAIIDSLIGAGDSETTLDFSRLERIVSTLGGELQVTPNGDTAGSFQISFPSKPSTLERVETLLSPFDPETVFAPQLSQHGVRADRILDTIKDFMRALSEGDLQSGQTILLKLAEQQYQAGLYEEIGTMARDLHDSLRGFVQTLNPALKEMVEDTLPDSGIRLEHILKLTENAANTTLDHVEAMGRKNEEDQATLVQLQELTASLQAIGEPAQKRLEESQRILEKLRESAIQNQESLMTVLTAQDYQDLTGQIIMKIIKLLDELQHKLLNIIRTFGVKIDQPQGKPPKAEELYGPAHEGVEGALSSQDDVDALLAEFGF